MISNVDKKLRNSMVLVDYSQRTCLNSWWALWLMHGVTRWKLGTLIVIAQRLQGIDKYFARTYGLTVRLFRSFHCEQLSILRLNTARVLVKWKWPFHQKRINDFFHKKIKEFSGIQNAFPRAPSDRRDQPAWVRHMLFLELYILRLK
jgi:hypothetical protein